MNSETRQQKNYLIKMIPKRNVQTMKIIIIDFIFVNLSRILIYDSIQWNTFDTSQFNTTLSCSWLFKSMWYNMHTDCIYNDDYDHMSFNTMLLSMHGSTFHGSKDAFTDSTCMNECFIK